MQTPVAYIATIGQLLEKLLEKVTGNDSSALLSNKRSAKRTSKRQQRGREQTSKRRGQHSDAFAAPAMLLKGKGKAPNFRGQGKQHGTSVAGCWLGTGLLWAS